MSTDTTTPRVSVMVLTRNRLDALRKCVASVMAQRFQDFELCILDDASDGQDTAKAMAEEFPDSRIRVFRTDRCLGVAGGRNFLMESSRGEILVSIDDDATFAEDDALDNVWESFVRSPKTVAMAFQVTNVVDGVHRPNVPFSRIALLRDSSMVSQRAQVAHFIGAGHAIRRCFVNAHGGYRSDMMFGAEELDLAYRIIQLGHLISYEPSIRVLHYPMASVVESDKDSPSSELYFYIRNRAYLAYRYLPWKYAIPYMVTWSIRYAVSGLRNNNLPELIRGAAATPRFLRGVEREVLGRAALSYLAKHGGRLWY